MCVAGAMLSFGKTEVERVEVVDEPSPVTVKHEQLRLMGVIAPLSVQELVSKGFVEQGSMRPFSQKFMFKIKEL